MVSISTVLLEVHWLTSPPPQPAPAVQAANAPPPPPKTEGPSTALSPVYPKKVETAPPADVSPQQPQVEQQPQKTQQQQAQQQPAQQPQTSNAPAAAITEPQKPRVETTGLASRADDNPQGADTRQGAQGAGAQGTSAVQPQAAASNNRCDVQACSSAYKSFRASDCSYQPYEGARRFCERPPVQRTAREQAEQPDRRRWSRDLERSRDVEPRDSERVIKRQIDDDRDESDADVDDDSDRMSLFRFRGPRW